MSDLGVYLVVLVLFGCAGNGAVGVAEQSAVVKAVIDGDTIELEGGAMVRYIGIDAPEVRVNKGGVWKLAPEDYGIKSKQYNETLTAGKNVRLEFDLQKKDKYNRLLAYVYAGDIFVNAKMVEEGYALTYTFPPNVKHTQKFIDMQASARKNNKGLWQNKTDEDITPEKAALHIGQVCTVKGRVKKTAYTKKAVFLNFGDNYKSDFTLVIFSNSLGEFGRNGIKPEQYYKGKVVRVTGRIKEYNGPEIIVNHPGEIEIIE